MDKSRADIEKLLNSLTDENEKIDVMNYYASKIEPFDSDYAGKLIEEALDLSRKSDYKKGIAQALLNKGIKVFRADNYKLMYTYITEAEEILRKLPGGQKLDLDKVLNYKALYFYYQGDYNRALDIYDEALGLARETGNLNTFGLIYINLSLVYYSVKDIEKAFNCCLEAQKALKNADDPSSFIINLNNAGFYCFLMGDYPRALSFLDEAYRLIKKKQMVEHESMILDSLSNVYQKMGDYSKAEQLLLTSVELAGLLKKYVCEITALKNLGLLYIETDRPDKAEKYLQKALDRSEKFQLNLFLREIHTSLKDIFVKKNDYKNAFYHQEQQFLIEKKAFDSEMNDKMRNIESELLRQANQRIKMISTIGQQITSSLDMNKVLDLIYTSINSVMEASIFGIARLNREKKRVEYDMFVEEGVHIQTFYRDLDDKNSLISLAIRERRDIIIGDFAKEYVYFLPVSSGFEGSLYKGTNKRIPQSILCCPLVISGEVTGVITVQSYNKNVYSISDMDSLKALASYVAIALKNAGQTGLIKHQNSQLTRAYDKLKQDIQLSRELQQAMIPLKFPHSGMFKVYGYFNFLNEVGGDLYDVYQISPDKTVILILDVVGHGVSAALVTAMAKILFFNKSKEHLCASSIVEEVNRELTPITGDSFTFFSLFYGIINNSDKTLEYVNAAHPEPFLIKKGGEVKTLYSSSLFVGLKKDFIYEQNTISLEPGDRLVLFTDGFFEIKGTDNKRFGENRLLETMLRYKSLDADRMIEKVNKELESYQGSQIEVDDRTMLVVDFN